VVDERVVAVKLQQIEQYHGELKTKQETVSRRKFLSSTTEQRAVERMFENAIQACADLAQHVATSEFDFEGTTSKGAIRVLHHQGVITEETADTAVAGSGSGMCLPTSTGTSITRRCMKLSKRASHCTTTIANRSHSG
jgi:hypothetical protein